MYYSDYKKYDVLNGPGIRHSLFVSGCTHGCKGCFNEKAQSFRYGEPFTPKEARLILEDLADSNVQGLSVLGGEPFDSWGNVWALIKWTHNRYNAHSTAKDIWVWTGYTFEDLLEMVGAEGLEQIDVLVDGRFEEDKKDLTLKYRGSSNQRVIDVQKSLEEGKVVLWE